MKYYTREAMDSDTLWNENREKYEREYERVRHKLPKNFLEEYEKKCEDDIRFHDNEILSIQLTNTRNGRYCNSGIIEILSHFGDEKFFLHYEGIRKYCASFDLERYTRIYYLYDEFLFLPDKWLSHGIYVGDDNTIYIEFRKLTFHKVQVK